MVSPPPPAVIPVPAQVTEPVSEIVNVQPAPSPPSAEPATLGIPAAILRKKTNKSIGASGDAVETVQTEANPSNGGLSRRPSNRRPKKKESRVKLASDAAAMENGKSSVLEEFEELRKRDEQRKWPTSDEMKKEVSPTIPSYTLVIVVRKYLEYQTQKYFRKP